MTDCYVLKQNKTKKVGNNRKRLNESLFRGVMVVLPAKALASSVGTARKCRRSDLLPTSMMTMLLSA